MMSGIEFEGFPISEAAMKPTNVCAVERVPTSTDAISIIQAAHRPPHWWQLSSRHIGNAQS